MTTPAPPPPTSPQRRLYREPEDHKVAGVCGGLADHLGVDPTVVRLVVVLLTLTTWFGVAFYAIAAVVVPRRPADQPRRPAPQPLLPEGSTTPVIVVLLVLVAVAIATDPPWFNVPLLGFLVLGAGLWLLLSDRESDSPVDPPTEGSTTTRGDATTITPEVAPPPGADLALTGDDDLTERSSSSVPDDGASSADPQGEVPPPVPPWGLGSPTQREPRPLDPPPGRHRSGSSGPVLALLLIGLGLVALVQVLGLASPAFDTTVAGVLVVIGGAMVVGAFRGQARWLALLGFPAVGLLLLDDVATVPIDAGIGDRDVAVADDGRNTDDHDLSAGSLTLDLSGVEGDRDDPPRIEASVGFGELVVLVPDDMTARVDASVGAGDITADGLDDGGDGEIDLRRRFVVERDDGTPEGEGRSVELDLRVDMGEVQVIHG